MGFGRSAGTAALVLAALATQAQAQPRPNALAPPPPRPAAVADGLEIGVGSMLAGIFPTVGGHVSVPAGRTRVEFGTQVLPWLVEDGGEFTLVPQVQLRVPLRAGPPGSRRSLLVGVSAFVIADHIDSVGRWEYDAGLRPHAGVSWQWQRSRHLDLRLDLQAVITFDSPVVAVPLTTFSMVWHRERRWS